MRAESASSSRKCETRPSSQGIFPLPALCSLRSAHMPPSQAIPPECPACDLLSSVASFQIIFKRDSTWGVC